MLISYNQCTHIQATLQGQSKMPQVLEYSSKNRGNIYKLVKNENAYLANIKFVALTIRHFLSLIEI
jgi:hypothetical protein